MTLRRKSREFAIQMLFEWDMTQRKPKEVEKNFWRQAKAAEPTRKFANELFEGAVSQAKTSDALNLLINQTRAELLKLQAQYASEAKFVSLGAPQMTDLKSRIDATADEIKGLESRLTSAIDKPVGAAPLSVVRGAEMRRQR